MSWIHDALRRGSRSARRGVSNKAAHVDSVLQTLGYRPRRRTMSPAAWLVSAVAGIVTIGLVGWMLIPETPAPTPVVARNTPPRASNPRPTAQATPTPAAPEPPPTTTVQPTPMPQSPAPQPSPSQKLPDSQVPLRAARVVPKAAPAASTGPAPVPPAVAAPMRDDFELALYYQRSGEFDQALVHYNAVLQRDELNVEAHNNLGMLYKDKGLLDDAAREFQRALFIDARYVRAHLNLGATLLQMNKPDEATAEFRAALAIEPRNVDALVNLALAQKASGQLLDARGTLVRALTVDPHSAAAHYNLAVQYEESGEAERALDHYRAFLESAGAEYASRAPAVRARIDVLSQRVR